MKTVEWTGFELDAFIQAITDSLYMFVNAFPRITLSQFLTIQIPRQSYQIISKNLESRATNFSTMSFNSTAAPSIRVQ